MLVERLSAALKKTLRETISDQYQLEWVESDDDDDADEPAITAMDTTE